MRIGLLLDYSHCPTGPKKPAVQRHNNKRVWIIHPLEALNIQIASKGRAVRVSLLDQYRAKVVANNTPIGELKSRKASLPEWGVNNGPLWGLSFLCPSHYPSATADTATRS